MRIKKWVMMAAVASVAGCTGYSSYSDTLQANTLTASFQPGGVANVIVVTAIDTQPLRGVVLVDPQGERTTAYSIDVNPSPIQPVTPGEALLLNTPGAPRRVVRINSMVSTASIRVSDLSRYATSWENWRIMVRLGDPAHGGRDVTLNAPPPG